MHNETIYHCPVCLGVSLEKLQLAHPQGEPITLDFCSRCGGMWFDYGEVQQLQQLKPHLAMKQIPIANQTFLMACHQCHHRMDRNLESCPSCGWKNIIDCPVCLKAMKRKESLGVSLDYCSECKGVWLDNLELAMIWNGYLDKIAHHEQQNRSVDDDSLFIDMLIWSPDLVYYGGRAAIEGTAYAISHAPEAFEAVAGAVTNAPEIAGAVFEGVGSVAGSIFEFIGDIIGGLFD